MADHDRRLACTTLAPRCGYSIPHRTLAIKLDAEGAPRSVQSVASTLGYEAPWTAVDPSFRYYAVSSIYGGAVGPPPPPGGFQTGTEFLNLIDLKTFTNTSLEDPDEQHR